MFDTRRSCTGPALLRGMATGISVALLISAVVGCEGVPRDTTATPPPPRESFTRGDEVYPAPNTVRDQRPATRTP